MTSQELTCKDVVELVTGYLDGSMEQADRERFEEHLSVCDGCTNYLHQMRETIRVTGMLTEEQVSEEQRDALLATFRGWRSRGD
jgi:predicted anti-sigma-YlaC factor YlaD